MNIKCTFRNQTAYRLMSALLAFALVFGLSVAAPKISGEAADPIDFNRTCSLKALAGSPEQAEELAGKLRIDLYQVASAQPVSVYDTYSYEFLPGFEEAEGMYNAKEPDWQSVAQKAAELVFAEDSGIQPVVSGMAEDLFSDLNCGLYLIIARGDGLEAAEYRTTVKQKDEEGNVREKLATLAYSDTRTYTYEPELISLPSRQATAEDGTIHNTTAGDGAWIYDMSVTLKPSEEPRYGSLEIVKTLQSYETGSEATFIFQIDAVLNGENVYSNVIPITFTSAGENRVVIDRIPVGAQVTVKEVYSGLHYEVETPDTVTPGQPIQLDRVLQVDFTNAYADKPGEGGAITNRFEYTLENGWKWEKQPAQDSADGA